MFLRRVNCVYTSRSMARSGDSILQVRAGAPRTDHNSPPS